jgi:glutathione S-transferase
MIVLYGDPISGNTRKVRWALEEASVPYEFRSVALGKGEHKKPDYLALNPNGKVPTIDDGGFVLWESDAILWHIAETRGQGTILPEGAHERALTHQWMAWNAYHLAEVTYRARVLRRTAMRLGTPFDQARHAEIIGAAGPVLSLLDGHLARRDHLVGSHLTIADIALAMNVSFGKEEGIALEPFANVVRWFDGLVARNAYRVAAG